MHYHCFDLTTLHPSLAGEDIEEDLNKRLQSLTLQTLSPALNMGYPPYIELATPNTDSFTWGASQPQLSASFGKVGE